MCDRCEQLGLTCEWPKGKERRVCVQCTKRWVKCRVAGTGVSNRADKAIALPRKKARVVLKATIESEDSSSEGDRSSSSAARVVEPPVGTTGMERAIWALASSVKKLAEAQVEATRVLSEEMEGIREVTKECVEGVWAMGQEVGNTAAMVELFTWGERFLRICEMGPPKEIGHEVGVRRRNSRELGLCGFNLEEGKGKGKEKEVASEDETMS